MFENPVCVLYYSMYIHRYTVHNIHVKYTHRQCEILLLYMFENLYNCGCGKIVTVGDCRTRKFC